MLTLIKKLFHRRNPPAREVTFDVFVSLPFYCLLNNETPFNDWKDPEKDVPPELVEVFRSSVNLYQLYLFYVVIGLRYGMDIAERALRLLEEKLNAYRPGDGDELRRMVTGMHEKASKYYEDPVRIKLKDGTEHEIPIEYRLAYEQLLTSENSPYYTRFDDIKAGKLPDIGKRDWDLTICLFHGKESAKRTFENFCELYKVTL